MLWQKQEDLFTRVLRSMEVLQIHGICLLYTSASLIGAGHQTAVLRSAAYGSPMAEYQDEMAGVGYYKFIEDLEKNFQEKKDEIVAGLQNAMAEIIRKDSFMVSYTGERESVEQVKTLSLSLIHI